MSYTIGQISRWDTGSLTAAGTAIATRRTTAEEVRNILTEGRDALADGWSGIAADAVLDAAEIEKSHVTKLADGLEDLSDALVRAEAALQPAVHSVRDRVHDAVGAGLVIGEDSIGPAPGRDDITQDTVNVHADAIRTALETVRSLDEHYGREIDLIASRLHGAIPPEVDRTPIPGPDKLSLGPAGAVLSGVEAAAPKWAHDLDPTTRGKHLRTQLPGEVGRISASGLRTLGRLAGPVGGGLTVYDGIDAYAKGETTALEATLETGGGIGGGIAGGAAAGALAGSFLGPAGALVGGGIGAALGAWAGHEAGEALHDAFIASESDDVKETSHNDSK